MIIRELGVGLYVTDNTRLNCDQLAGGVVFDANSARYGVAEGSLAFP